MLDRSQEETRSKRDAILDAARTLFARKGYEDTTIAEIAQVAGVAVGTVYLYFRNKHEVYTGVAINIEATIAEVFQDPTIINMPFKEMLYRMVDAPFRVGRKHMDLLSLLQIDMQSPEEILQHKTANEHITNALDAVLQRAIAKGELAPFNTEMYARILNLLGTAVLHQCFAVELGEREELYRTYMLEVLERLFFGPSLQEGKENLNSE